MMKVKGLRAGIALDASDVIYKYFDEVRKNQGVNGMTLLDSEDEYQSDSPNFGGAGDIMLQFVQQLSGSLGIPMVRLYGQSPTGLSSTGESDLRTYYDEIKRLQETILSDPLERILRVAYQSCFGERVPEDFDFKFKPLWQMSESEKSTLSATDTNTIIAAFNAGLVSEEIALKELKQSSNETGIWTNITDEYIESVSIAVPEPVLTEDPENG
jgi:phage-related protein (TIGR01555 family)